MSRKSIFETEAPHQFRTNTLTRLFDLLLFAGALACTVLTVFLFTGNRSATPPPSPTPVAVAAATPTPEPVVVAGSSPTPDESPAATPEVTPEATPEATPPAKPASEDLLAAMSDYVNFVNQGDAAKARAMRADPNAPPTEKLRQVKSMTLASIAPYPRISRTKGSVYVVIKLDKGGPEQTWKGRIDWEKKGSQWVTVNWDSAAAKPSAE